jgi:HlyD family secretion protein
MRIALKLTDEQTAIVQEATRRAAAVRAERQKAREAQSEAGGNNGAGGGEGGGPAETKSGERRGGNGAGGGDGAARNRFMERLEAALEPTLSAEQKPLLESWRKARQSGRSATVWVLGPDRQPAQQQIRLGIGDEQFAELIGGGLKQGDRVITRQRFAAKK